MEFPFLAKHQRNQNVKPSRSPETSSRRYADYEVGTNSTWRERAQEAHTRARYDDAVAAYHQAIFAEPYDADLYQNLGNVYGLVSDPEQAIVYLSAAVRLDPEMPDAWYSLALAHGEAGNVAESIGAYRRSIACDPEYMDSYWNLGITLFDQGEYEQAVDIWLQQRIRHPLNPNLHVRLGDAYFHLNRLDTALVEYEFASKLAPSLAAAFIGMGNVFAFREDWLRALAMFQKAAQNDTDNPEIHLHIGAVYDQITLHDKAYEAYQKVIEIGGRRASLYVDLYVQLGIHYARQGIYGEARKMYQRGLILAPDSAQLQAHLAALDLAES